MKFKYIGSLNGIIVRGIHLKKDEVVDVTNEKVISILKVKKDVEHVTRKKAEDKPKVSSQEKDAE